MEDSDKSVDLAELLRRVLEARLLDLHVALPGRVERYDAAQEVADVRPMLRRAIPSAETGEAVLETLPVIPSVPVCWPSGGGCAMTFPLAVGDPVELVFQDFDLDAYRRSGGDLSDPGVRSAHGLSGAVAIPCAVSGPVGADASHVKIVLGAGVQLRVGGSSDAAALASKVDALQTAYNSHTHSGVTAGGGTSGAVSTPSALTFASARIKVDG
jgi:hypothetical protein